MALVKFDKETFVESVEPGLVSIIVQSFQEKLESKLNGIVEQVYKELEAELPTKLEVKLHRVLDFWGFPGTKIVVELVNRREAKK